MKLAFLLLMLSPIGWAQLYFFEELQWQQIRQPPPKPVIARITATLTATTPWGPYEHTETGQFWRSRDGKVRQDNQYEISRMLDLGDNLRSLTTIDSRRQEVFVQNIFLDNRVRYRARWDTTGSDFRWQSTKPKKTGQTVVDGLRVTMRKGQAKSGETFEVWTADDLDLVVVFKVRLGNTEFTQRLQDIRIEDPDPSVFRVPSGLKMVIMYPPNQAHRCSWEEISISGQPATETREVCP